MRTMNHRAIRTVRGVAGGIVAMALVAQARAQVVTLVSVGRSGSVTATAGPNGASVPPAGRTCSATTRAVRRRQRDGYQHGEHALDGLRALRGLRRAR